MGRIAVVGLALAAACGARQPTLTEQRLAAVVAAQDAIATRDPAVIRKALRGPVIDRGLWFDDAECRARFAQPRRIETPELDAFAQCLAGLGLEHSPRYHELPDVALLTYAPGIEVEAWLEVGPDGSRLLQIGFAGNDGTRAWLPTVAPEALEPLRIAGEPHASDDAARPALDPLVNAAAPDEFVWAWFKVCLDHDGNVIDVGARAAAKEQAVSAMGLAIRRWKFRPFLLGGQPMAVCSLVLATHPSRGPNAVPLMVPALEPSTVGVAFPERLSSGESSQSTHESVPPVALDRILVANVQFCVDTEGNVDHVNMYESSGWRWYDKRLIAMVRASRFRPPRRSDGTPSRACRDVTFSYTQTTDGFPRGSVWR